MDPTRHLFAITLFATAFLVRAQNDASAPPSAVMNDPVQGGWHSSTLQPQVGPLQQLVESAPADQQARLDLFRTERSAALARNQGHILDSDQTRLEAMTKAMSANDPDGFETRIALFHLHFPKNEAWLHLEQATHTGAGRMELIGPQLVNAARLGDEGAMVRHGRAMLQNGGMAPGLLSLADDLLLSVDRNGILVTVGEMDAYPTWARQYGAGHRRDVLVVDQRLLADPGYRRLIWAMAGARGAVPGNADRFVKDLARSTDRPVHLSLALGQQALSAFGDRLYVTGLAARYSDKPYDNAAVLVERWPQMDKALNAGPLSRNYLLPAATLLQHYRSIGLEAGYAPLEHELRQMARALGATEQLYRIGVLAH